MNSSCVDKSINVGHFSEVGHRTLKELFVGMTCCKLIKGSK